ncbi:MAG: hypothetical protein MJA84_12160 [Firmicutes bacterium]|nr:hypothetical protein [Bacillota bacterium]
MPKKKDVQPGWRKLIGAVELSADPQTLTNTIVFAQNAQDEEAKSGALLNASATEKKYLARFFSPMSAIAQNVTTGIRAGKEYEVGFNVASDCQTGFFSVTVTFLDDAGATVGFADTIGVRLCDLQTDTYSRHSFVTRPAPEGATKAQIVFSAIGATPQKVVDMDKIYVQEVAVSSE